MDLAAAGLKEQPFRTHGRPLVFVPYAAQRAAFEFLNDSCNGHRGVGLFRGPSLSGKTAIIREFVDSAPNDTALAIIDGAGRNTPALLESMLSQFGYDLKLNSVNELLNMVKVFVMQQTASQHAPLLIVENTQALNPSGLRVLCELAELRVKSQFAVQIVLASDRSISSIIEAPAMEAVAQRLSGEFRLEPMTETETMEYLHTKLRAGGSADPRELLPDEACEHLYAASGGWPGVVDRLMLLALAKAERCPIDSSHIERPVVSGRTPTLLAESESADRNDSNGAASARPPTLFLTYNGRTLREIEIIGPRLLIGRSAHNDVCINSRYISRHHAMFVRQQSATFLMDLNSTNGTFVNSRRISNHVLVHDDVISIGNHGIKFFDPSARERRTLGGIGYDDTAVMRSLHDMRKLLARENTETLLLPKVEPSSASDA